MNNDKTPLEQEAKKKKLFQVIKWVFLLVGSALVLAYKIFNAPKLVSQIGMWMVALVFLNGVVKVIRGKN